MVYLPPAEPDPDFESWPLPLSCHGPSYVRRQGQRIARHKKVVSHSDARPTAAVLSYDCICSSAEYCRGHLGQDMSNNLCRCVQVVPEKLWCRSLSFFSELLPYFLCDPKIGIVQSPQVQQAKTTGVHAKRSSHIICHGRLGVSGVLRPSVLHQCKKLEPALEA